MGNFSGLIQTLVDGKLRTSWRIKSDIHFIIYLVNSIWLLLRVFDNPQQ